MNVARHLRHASQDVSPVWHRGPLGTPDILIVIVSMHVRERLGRCLVHAL